MSFDNIATMAGEFKDMKELQAYCDAQYVQLDSALKRVHELELEVAHLKELLSGAVPLVEPHTEATAVAKTVQPEQKVDLVVRSDEQTICEVQINMLKSTAMNRPLTLEETKRLDLLVKNLSLIKAQQAAIPADYSKLPPNVSAADLIAIAAVPESDEG
jgi:regulator of replication initiation timing